ncbi:MAG: ATP phosphoribosyltransferase regulatory subunit [Burkholderiales bacterium PBB1]|nr:MAG: ATP phosphoribosyltransferase regulatory subunit [Burkholderiales bacterium PBB1]
MSAWLLPEHIADVLPAQARQVERMRRTLLDVAGGYGYELVIPPLVEHLDSLLSGTGRELDLRTFKLVDQLSGRTIGMRADSTPQVARIDAHLLNREGVTRLCYCGPLLHTLPSGLHGTREPLQFGAEIFGHPGLEADLEIIDLALDCAKAVGLQSPTLDMSDARIVRGLLAGAAIDAAHIHAIVDALAAKDGDELGRLTAGLMSDVQAGLQCLLRLYGNDEVLTAAEVQLPKRAPIVAALRDLRLLGRHVREAYPDIQVGYDLADVGGYAYYSGARFALYTPGSCDALLRGGRYDEVGAVFGRSRAAVGFSVVDLKELAEQSPVDRPPAAIRAPWSEEPSLRAAVRRLRQQGESVICLLPGHDMEGQGFDCDRQLVMQDGAWVVRTV